MACDEDATAHLFLAVTRRVNRQKYFGLEEDVHRLGGLLVPPSASLSLSVMTVMLRLFGRVDVVAGERGACSGAGETGRRLLSAGRESFAWRKSSTALRWKESCGAEVLSASLSFAARLRGRIGRAISARLIISQIEQYGWQMIEFARTEGISAL